MSASDPKRTIGSVGSATKNKPRRSGVCQMLDKAAQIDAFILMTDGATKLANADAINSSLLPLLKEVFRNKNGRLF